MTRAERAELMKRTWYKVLVDGKSCHGGEMSWPLPVGDAPAKKGVRVGGNLVLCKNGIHVTDDPSRWLKVGCEVYECQVTGLADYSEVDRKAVVRSCRLLRAAWDAAWGTVRV